MYANIKWLCNTPEANVILYVNYILIKKEIHVSKSYPKTCLKTVIVPLLILDKNIYMLLLNSIFFLILEFFNALCGKNHCSLNQKTYLHYLNKLWIEDQL